MGSWLPLVLSIKISFQSINEHYPIIQLTLNAEWNKLFIIAETQKQNTVEPLLIGHLLSTPET